MRKFRFLSVVLALCMCLSFSVPAASAAGNTAASYAQASTLAVGQPITVTGTANYGAYTNNGSTTLLAIDAPDGTWFAAIGPYSAEAFRDSVDDCTITLNGVYAGTMDINGMPIIDVQQGTLTFEGWVTDRLTFRFSNTYSSLVSYSGSTSELLAPVQKVLDEAAAEATAKAAEEAAAKAAEPQWKKTGRMVWIPTRGGECWHTNPYCSGMIDPEKVDLGYAEYMGFRDCKRC